MPSTPRLAIAILVACSVMLLAPAAMAAVHSGHIDLQDGLTLAQQFGYAPEFRQHVVTFDAISGSICSRALRPNTALGGSRGSKRSCDLLTTGNPKPRK